MSDKQKKQEAAAALKKKQAETTSALGSTDPEAANEAAEASAAMRDAGWGGAGNGGAEEARKMLSVALPERPPQYEEKPGTPGGTPGGVSKAAEYIPSASLETEYWRRASNRGATSQLTLTAPPTPV